MIRTFFSVVLAVSVGCSSKAPIEKLIQTNEIDIVAMGQESNEEKRIQNVQKLKIDTISEVEFNALLREAHNNLLDTTKLSSFKSNGIVKILNSSKKVVREYRDTLAESDDTDQRLFRIEGQFDEIKTTVVTGQYYESGECLLVNNETGKETKVFGIPKLEQDNKFMFSCSMALGYDVMPTGFQIWEIVKQNQCKLLYEEQTKDWGIYDFYWVGDRTLILDARNIQLSQYYLKLSF